MLHTLLLNATGESISFISERKVFKLLSKDKIVVLTTWDENYTWGRASKMKHPAVVQLRHRAPWIPKKKRFNRHGVFKLDKYTCQYCAKLLTPSKLTVDHLVPRTQGGENSWRNCVTACFDCNNQKGARTPEQAKMKLLNKPTIPGATLVDDYLLMKRKHPEWSFYLGVDKELISEG